MYTESTCARTLTPLSPIMAIRQKQMEQLAERYQESFVQRAAKHLRQHYSEQTTPMTEEALAQEIRYGIERGQVHGFNTQRDVTKYLNLMFEFGRHFDLDPNCGWAHAILADPRPRNIERLYDAARAVSAGGVDGRR